MRLDEIVIFEAQTPREAHHELLAHSLRLTHELQTRVFEPGNRRFRKPASVHVRAELHLVALLAVRLAGRWPDLGILLPPGIEVCEWDGGFGSIWEGEEGFRGAEHVLDFWEGDPVIDETEETVCFGGVD